MGHFIELPSADPQSRGVCGKGGKKLTFTRFASSVYGDINQLVARTTKLKHLNPLIVQLLWLYRLLNCNQKTEYQNKKAHKD